MHSLFGCEVGSFAPAVSYWNGHNKIFEKWGKSKMTKSQNIGQTRRNWEC
jgi:hypothetical protein